MTRVVVYRISLLLLAALLASALKLPDYIKPCARSDPNVNECARKSAQAAVPHFINGDPKYKVPPLEPLLISELYISEGTRSVGMTLEAKNATMHGLSKVVMKAFRYDFEKQHMEGDWFFPQLDVEVMYKVTGRVLLLPIQGQGPGSFSLKNVSAYFKHDYDLVKKKDGKEYLVPTNPKLRFDATGFTMRLENLFNGDKFLGENMNKFLNENWDEILKDIGPALADALGQYLTQVLGGVFGLVPFDEALPNKL